MTEMETAQTAASAGTKIEVFVGTYDNYLFGYRVAQPTEDVSTPRIPFTIHNFT